MLGIAALLAAAALGHALARGLRIPAIPTLIIAGGLLAATGATTPELLENAVVLGVTFVLFVTGIELNPRRARAQRRAAVRVGVVQFFALAAAGFLLALLLGFVPNDAAYLALALTASSTLVVVRLLRGRRQMFEPFGRLVVGVLLIQNLLVIAFIPVLTRLPGGPADLATGVLATAGLVALTAAARRWIAPRILRLDGDEEPLLIGVLALLFVFIGAADALDLPLAAGAFLAGIALSDFPLDGVVRSQIASIGDFFAAVFFTALGALVSLPSLAELGQALAFALLLLLATPPLVAAIAERTGLSARPSLEAGLLLAQASELSLVVVLFGLLEGQVGTTAFTVVATVTVITMILTPFITADHVVWSALRLHPLRVEGPAAPEGGHILVLGAGTTGMPLVETLLAAGHRVVVVDDDPAVVAALREADLPCVRGDASDISALRLAGADRARTIISTIRRPADNARLLRFARGVPTFVRVFDDDDARWVRRLGGRPVLYSAAAAEDILAWFDRRRRPAEPLRDAPPADPTAGTS
ncbi:MAG: cation:proton antiporter [Gemmatimonadota bacterium]